MVRKRPPVTAKPSTQLPPGADSFVKQGGIDAELQKTTTPPSQPETPAIAPTPQRKRGRPATGKRSAGWIGRTYYVKQETDLDVEEWLLKLKRQGINVDKSELVEMLLSAWVKWQQGENLELNLVEISPIQKGK